MSKPMRCEAGRPDYSGQHPVIVQCGKPAKLRGVALVCDECWPTIRLREAERRQRLAALKREAPDG